MDSQLLISVCFQTRDIKHPAYTSPVSPLCFFTLLSCQSPSEDFTDGRLERRDRDRVRLLHVQPAVFCQPAGSKGERFPAFNAVNVFLGSCLNM